MFRPPLHTRAARRRLAQWLLAGAGLLGLLAGCLREPRPGPETSSQPEQAASSAQPLRPDPPTQRAALAFTGDFRTFVRPCGCTPDQPGGIVRIATILAAARRFAGSEPSEALLEAERELAGAASPQDLTSLLKNALSSGAPPEDQAQYAERIWPVECGNFSWAGGRYADIRVRGYIKQLHHAGYRAVVPGAGELQMKAEDAKALKGSEVPLVSCNLKLKEPLFDLVPYLELAPGWYLSGVSSWRPLGETVPTGSWWELADPVASAKALLAQLPADAKLVLVATYQPEKVYQELRALPLAGLIGPGSYRSTSERGSTGQAETTLMPSAAENDLARQAEQPAPPAKGVFLPLLLLSEQGGKLNAASRYLEVDQRWPDNAEALRIEDGQGQLLVARLRAEREALAKASGIENGQFGMSQQLLPEDQQTPDRATLEARLKAEAAFTGTPACAKCHPAADAVWLASKHSHALDTLVANHEENNLDCLQCHTVGMYELSGFDPGNPLPALGAVGCENCHGPGSQHLAAVKLAELSGGVWPAAAERWQGEKYSIHRGSLPDCTKCHDTYNSPRFEPAAYWAKIKH